MDDRAAKDHLVEINLGIKFDSSGEEICAEAMGDQARLLSAMLLAYAGVFVAKPINLGPSLERQQQKKAPKNP